ncbi:alpha/beta hydrolase [Bacillus sp. 31A1R]|uniref:Alpha/beta hydrolase n=1 Tax=Robertmurraya mangrovi TaxID=3098077 RepID=A0ABU5IWJ9_9BACI|nr:alpha/beta hydrolase [Bacillus sp. 31A1R]MDZ5471505.1 alpha/beta hydrolase [Bacillus sp. 31A1R]
MIEEKVTLSNSIGINVKYSIDMKNDKETVLFLHFSGGTLEMWNGILPMFGKEFNIVAPDYRGHGKSDKPLTGYHIDDMAHDIYLLLNELNINQCHIVGSSLGAEVGLSLAATYPEKVKSLVCEGALYNEFGEYGLFNGSVEEIAEEKKRLSAGLAERVLPNCSTREEYIEEVKGSFIQQGLWNEYVLRFLESTMVQNEEGKFTNRYQNHVRTEYITKYWEVQFDHYYRNIQCPILFLPSEEESKNEKINRSLQYFSSLVNGYEIKHIEGSLHAYVWLQYPEKAGKTVEEFIEKVK